MRCKKTLISGGFDPSISIRLFEEYDDDDSLENAPKPDIVENAF